MIISIIGVGEVGGAVANLIIQEYPNIQLNLLDNSTDISGRILDLAHGGASNNVDVRFNDLSLLNLSDYIVYCAGASIAKGESRNSVAQKNKSLVQAIFNKVEPKPSCSIIVITNPVELVACWISELFKHQIQVIGTGTLLDSFRLKYLLVKKFKTSIDHIDALVIGEHGENMVPFFSHSKVNGKAVLDLLEVNELEELKKELINSASTIRQTEKVTKFGVAQTALRIIKWLESSTSEILPVSILVDQSMKEEFNLQEDLFVSFPSEIKEGRLRIVNSLECTNEEFEFLKDAIASIRRVYLAEL